MSDSNGSGEFRELRREIKNTAFISNPYSDNDLVHPAKTPLDYAPVEDARHALRLFAERIASLSDADYGDFMRCANSYLLDLWGRIGQIAPEIRRKLRVMQFYIQFRPYWNIEKTRKRLQEDIAKLEHWIERKATPLSGSDRIHS